MSHRANIDGIGLQRHGSGKTFASQQIHDAVKSELLRMNDLIKVSKRQRSIVNLQQYETVDVLSNRGHESSKLVNRGVSANSRGSPDHYGLLSNFHRVKGAT